MSASVIRQNLRARTSTRTNGRPRNNHALVRGTRAPKRRRLANEPKINYANQPYIALPYGNHYSEVSEESSSTDIYRVPTAGSSQITNVPTANPLSALPFSNIIDSSVVGSASGHEEYSAFESFGNDDEFIPIMNYAAIAVAEKEAANWGRHERRKAKQWDRWLADVIPELIQVYLAFEAATDSGRLPSPGIETLPPVCGCCPSTSLLVTLASLNGIHIFLREPALKL